MERIGIISAILLVPVAGALSAGQGPEPDEEIRQLREELGRVKQQYEMRIQALERAIDRLEQQRQTVLAAPPPAPALQPSTQGNEMNPRISVIGDFNAMYRDASKVGGDRNLDYALSELEFGFQSEIDPYLRFDVFAAFHEHRHEVIIPIGGHETEAGHEHGDEEGGLEAGLEEAFITTLSLPAGLQLRAGRYRQKMGRINLTHPHEQPWADQPTVNRAFFGDDQLIDDGVELNWLTPASFFWELSGSLGRGPGESPTWGRSAGDDFLYLLHNRFFWDLNRDTSLEFGQTWATGPAATAPDVETAEVWGADLVLRWIPSNYRELTWQTEAFRRDLPVPHWEEHHHEGEQDQEDHDHEPVFRDMEDWGAYTFFQWRFSKRWFAGIRLDYLDYDDGFFEEGVSDRWDASAIGEFWPSEFQTLRFQYKRTWDDFLEDPLDILFLNWVWVIGAHGAHSF